MQDAIRVARGVHAVDTMHELVKAIWLQVLGPIELESTTDFFEIGGSSLDAMRISAIVSKRTGAKLSIRVLLTSPVFGDYCAQVMKALPVEPT